jgi:transglutaminase-like putative cysteine protease
MLRKILIIFIVILLATNTFGLELYENKSMMSEFSIEKEIFINQDEGEVEFNILTYNSWENANYKSKMITREDKVTSISGKNIPVSYKLDQYGNKIIVFGMNGKLESKYNFKSTYKVYTEVNPFIEKEMEIKYTKEQLRENKDFLEESEYILLNTKKVDRIITEINTDNFYELILNLQDWITENIKYDYESLENTAVKDYLSILSDSETVIKDKRAICVEYANVVAAILRSKNIPTKIITGLAYSDEGFGQHAWVEVLTPENKWISYDPTYKQAGFIDASHIKQNEFADYSQSRDTYTAYFETSKIKLNTLGDPYNVKAEITNKHKFDILDLNYSTEMYNDDIFELCISNDENKKLLAQINWQVYPDFDLYEVNKTILIDGEYCINSKLNKDLNQTMIYNWLLNTWGIKDEVDLKIFNKKSNDLTINSIKPELNGRLLNTKIELESPEETKIILEVIMRSDENTIINTKNQNFFIEEGINKIEYLEELDYNTKSAELLIKKDNETIVNYMIKTNIPEMPTIYDDPDSIGFGDTDGLVNFVVGIAIGLAIVLVIITIIIVILRKRL